MSKKLPWWKFFSKDFQADADLKTVSLEAVGLWSYMMCVMHDSPRRGYLTLDARPMTNDQLAAISGRSTATVARLVTELTARVFSVSPDGIIFSRRMVKETALGEIRAKVGKKGGNKTQSILLKQNSSKTNNDDIPCVSEILLKQNSSKRSSKPLSSCINSSKENSSEGEEEEGFGEKEILLKQNSSKPMREFENSPAGLAQEFVFYQTASKENTFIIREKIEGLVADGHSLGFIAELIRTRKNKAERFFHIERRLEKTKRIEPPQNKPFDWKEQRRIEEEQRKARL